MTRFLIPEEAPSTERINKNTAGWDIYLQRKVNDRMLSGKNLWLRYNRDLGY